MSVTAKGDHSESIVNYIQALLKLFLGLATVSLTHLSADGSSLQVLYDDEVSSCSAQSAITQRQLERVGTHTLCIHSVYVPVFYPERIL